VRCFLHADDCGITRSATNDILECLDRGPLAGASVMTGGAFAKEAFAALAARPGVLAAVHLNLLEGAPTAPASALPGLTQDGLFRHSLGSLYALLRFSPPGRGKRLLSEIRTEFSAQIDSFRAQLPAFPLRLDGHLHVHALPPLGTLMRELVREHAPAYVRVPLEPFHNPPAPLGLKSGGHLRRALLALWSGPLAAMLDAEGAPHNRFLIGAFASGSLTLERLRVSLAAARRAAKPGELAEIMIHPGGLGAGEKAPDLKKPYRSFYASPGRKAEKNLLLSRELAEELGGCLAFSGPARENGAAS
jgi:predicted glycoside hydrolase/deacetylase ChbG (UPF0249 family)